MMDPPRKVAGMNRVAGAPPDAKAREAIACILERSLTLSAARTSSATAAVIYP